MKSALIRVLFLLFATGVFGDLEKTETVSVIEGDSVTLHTDVTEIRSSDEIEWRLNGYRIAIISDDSIMTEGASRDRLQLDNQTGDLKITNIKTTDSGEYKLQITSIRGSPVKIFSVSVVSGVDEVKSVTVGDSVSLNSGTIIQRDDVIEWRFGDLNSLIAENRKTGNFSTSDGRFRDRLQLDYWTGSLTIRNTSTKHSGLYEADIRKSRSLHTIHKSYSVTVSGEMTSALSVKEGDSVTLHTDLTEMQTDDFMQWMLGDTLIAEVSKAQKRFLTYDGPDGRFRDRLKLDHQTGSLTITDTRFTDSGLYELKISSSRFIINRRVTVTVTDPGWSPLAIAGIVVVVGLLVYAAVNVAVAAVWFYHHHWISKVKASSTLAVMEGESVPLITHGIGILKDEDIQWKFGGVVIAKWKGLNGDITINDDVLDKKFKGRLLLVKSSGYLIIINITTTDSGHYELWSGRSGNKPLKTIYVSVYAETGIVKEKVPVKMGGSVKLETGVTDIKKDLLIQWKFRLDDSPIAQITGGIRTTSPFATGWVRFRGRLKLDQDGSLTISKIKLNHTGCYVLYITADGETTMKLFNVKVVNNPEEVSLRSREAP